MEKPISIEKKIIAILNSKNPDRIEIIKILQSDLKTKIQDGVVLYYCSCGYPLGIQIEEVNHKNELTYRYELLYDILNYEADIDKFCTFTYCPKCNKMIEEKQY